MTVKKENMELSQFFKDFYTYFEVVTVFSWANEEDYKIEPKPIIRHNPSGWHHVLMDMGYYGTEDGDVYCEEDLFFELLNEEFLIMHRLDFEQSSFAQAVVASCKKHIPLNE